MAAIIFDFDGVIASSLDYYFQLYSNLADNFGVPRPTADPAGFREWYNPRWEENYRSMGFDGEQLADAMGWLSSHIDYDDVCLYPEVPAALRRLSERYPLGIASTTKASLIERRLRRDGLWDLFKTVHGGGSSGSDKIGMVGDAFKCLGALPNQTVMIGDTAHDIEAAHHWGLRSVGVSYGWVSRPRVAAACPDVVIDSPADLERAIEQALNGGAS